MTPHIAQPYHRPRPRQPSRILTRQDLTADDVAAIIDAAARAIARAAPKARTFGFQWRGHALKASLTQFRTLVRNDRGEALCCRWH